MSLIDLHQKGTYYCIKERSHADNEERKKREVAAELKIPDDLKKDKWKVKIRDRERNEDPHATIIRGTKAWRFDLRHGGIMDPKPKPSEVPQKLLDHITKIENWDWLKKQWDKMYPNNPVEGSEDDND